jgi:peptidoglycan/LPS O-acetylase OafA/YrhL
VLVDRLVSAILGAGWIGVDLFFVLSGFLITGNLYDSETGTHHFSNFYARRVLRIFPVYHGCLLARQGRIVYLVDSSCLLVGPVPS